METNELTIVNEEITERVVESSSKSKLGTVALVGLAVLACGVIYKKVHKSPRTKFLNDHIDEDLQSEDEILCEGKVVDIETANKDKE